MDNDVTSKILELYRKIQSYSAMYTSTQYRAEDKLTYDYIKPNVRGSILDIGCGAGDAISHLSINPENYTGVDISPDMLVQAHTKFPDYKFVLNDGKAVKSQYDTIICLYGGYLTVEDMFSLYENNLNLGGQLFFHIPTENRNMTVIGNLEKELAIPMELATKEKVDWVRKFGGKVIKTNAFNKYKSHLPIWLYYTTIVIEQYLPLDVKLYTWILFHLRK